MSIQSETGALRSGGLPTLVTGRVTSLDEDRYYFVHLPGMLQRLMTTAGTRFLHFVAHLSDGLSLKVCFLLYPSITQQKSNELVYVM